MRFEFQSRKQQHVKVYSDEIMENHCNDTINEMGNFVITITLSLAEPFFFLALNVIYSYVGLTRHEKEATYKMFEFSMTRGRYAAGEYLRKMKLKLLKHTSKDTIELISTSSWITCLQCVNSWSVIPGNTICKNA